MASVALLMSDYCFRSEMNITPGFEPGDGGLSPPGGTSFEGPPVVYEIARDPDTVADQAQLLAGGPERKWFVVSDLWLVTCGGCS